MFKSIFIFILIFATLVFSQFNNEKKSLSLIKCATTIDALELFKYKLNTVGFKVLDKDIFGNFKDIEFSFVYIRIKEFFKEEYSEKYFKEIMSYRDLKLINELLDSFIGERYNYGVYITGNDKWYFDYKK